MDVECRDEVSDPLAAVVGGAEPFGPATASPAASVARAQALGSLLVEADHNTVFGAVLTVPWVA